MRRQVVVIMTDTQGTNMLGCYGHPELRTPRIDRLAAEGIRFDRSYTCQPVCGPARAALFTGQFPHTCGSWANSMPLGGITRTIGQRLQAADIRTAYIGKWHLDGSDYAVERFAPGALVIFTSDHGDMLGSHRLWNKGPVAYEEAANIPFLVRWPGQVPAGATSRHPVSHIDVVPTILDYFGQPPLGMLEGRSLLPCFRDPDVRVNDAVFIEFGRYETDHDGFGGLQLMRAICDGRHKLVINLLSSDELYDLDGDPGEMTNLIADPGSAVIRDGLHDKLLDWMNRTRDPFRGYYWERRPWRTDARSAAWSCSGMTRQRVVEPGEPQQLDYNTGVEIRETTRQK